MSKRLKVFGGSVFYGSPRKQVRIIIAAYTKKEAFELVNTVNHINYAHFSSYFCETGNDIELSIANEVGLWIADNNFIDRTYTKLNITNKK